MKRALVTGASDGIGRALLPLLAREDYALCLVGRNENALASAVQSLPDKAHAHAKILVADLTEPTQVAGLLQRCHAAWGNSEPIDLLVNCAGYGVSGRVQDIPAEAYKRCWQVNFFSPVLLVQQVLPEMLKAGRGMIVNVTSGVGGRALPFISPYASAKAALNSFTDGLRVELRDTEVRTLLFSPGPVDSGFQKAKQHFGPTKLQFPPLNGRDPAWVAAQLFDAIEAKEERVNLGANARLVEHLNYWSPKLVDRVLQKKFRLKLVPDPGT